MHLRPPRAIALMLLMVLPATANAAGWRIAVGGGRITGYLGVLAHNGLPRQVLTDAELADLEVLRRYRVVIATWPVEGNEAVCRAIEQYVAEGGCAITEVAIAPSPAALPGQRFGPKRSPNITFQGHDHPISLTMRGINLVATSGSQAMAIAPATPQAATVLAHYTDQDVPDKYRGDLTGGRRDLPAVLLLQHGQGAWLYAGAPLATVLALRGLELQPAVLEALRLFSDGALTARLSALPPEQRLLPGVSWGAGAAPPPQRRAPREGSASDPPEGFEPLDLPADAPEDFVLTGELAPGASAEVLLPWFDQRWHRALRVDAATVRLVETEGGREVVLAEARRSHSDGAEELIVRRRPWSVTVFLGRSAVLTAALGPMAGVVAARGLGEAYLQQCAPVVFADDFMRAQGQANPWETPAGSWELYKVEGDPEQGANPFAFRAQDGELATALAGYEFWDDYDFAAAVRPTARAAEILAHYQADDDCVALRLRLPEAGAAATLELLRRLPGEERMLAAAEVEAEPDRWHQLRLRISRGRALAGLDGRDLLVAADESLRGRGRIGLQVQGGGAYFDDVVVAPWEATPLPLAGEGAWRVERGTLRAAGEELVLAPSGEARALAPSAGCADVRATAQVRLEGARQAGLLLRYRSPGDHYALTLARKSGVVLRLVRRERGKETVLAERPVGGGPKAWHELGAVLRGRHIEAALDGTPVLSAADDAFGAGEFGLQCAGGAASFRNAVCWPVDNRRALADPPTPPWAGIIDLHTWAGAGSGWMPDPNDLDRYWHRGLFVDDVEVRLGVHRGADGSASASLMIGNGADPDAGWVAQAEQDSPTEPVTVRLLRAGRQVGSAQARSWSAAGYALSLQRVGGLMVASVDGEAVVQHRDPQPLPGLTRVGFRRDAAVLDPADAQVLSGAVHTWTFNTAPTDWRVLSGTWEISNRWACAPQWTWLAGWNQDGVARIHTRRAFVGDQTVDIYVGARMMPNPSGRGTYEELRDLHFGLCEDGAGGGYQIVLGGQSNTLSSIARNGQLVATTTQYAIPQAERHNNWMLVTLAKTGPTISVRVWDREVLSFTDDQPIEGGFVAVGTEGNGLVFPRITVYGATAD
ncbi:MAG: hypothetical protein AB7Y46_07795 [Armatimonadota bacterium]